MPDISKKLLLTGRPGCGKTTVIVRFAELLKKNNIAGFYTQELCSAGRRTGFSVRTFDGAQGMLSSINLKHGPRLGKYRVDVHGFEKIILPELERPPGQVDVFIIDEIGKMECFSPAFVRAAAKILQSDVPLAATIALKGAGFIAEVKSRQDIELIIVTPANRDDLPREIADRLALFRP